MPSLAGAITTLGLIGSSVAAPVFDSEYETIPRPYTVTFTQLGLNGSPGPRNVTFDHVELSDVEHVVSDDALISVTESPIDSQEIVTNDVVRLSLTDTAQLFNNLGLTDTVSLSLSESISLVIAGVTLKTASDTASITLSGETVTVSVSLEVTDTATLTLSGEVATVDVSVEQVAVADTVSISLDDQASVNVFAGFNDVNVSDTVALTLGENATVDRIDFSITTPRSRTVFVRDRKRH